MIDGSMRSLMGRHSRATSDNKSTKGSRAALASNSRSANVKRLTARAIGGDDGGNKGPHQNHPHPKPIPHTPTITSAMDATPSAPQDDSTSASPSLSTSGSSDSSVTSLLPTSSTSSTVTDPPTEPIIPSSLSENSSSSPSQDAFSSLVPSFSQPNDSFSTSANSATMSQLSMMQSHSSSSFETSLSPLSTPSPSFTPPSSAPSASSSPDSPTMAKISASSHNTGAIAGGVIGAFIFLCLLFLGLCVFLKHRRRKRTPPSAEFREYAARYEAAAHGSNDDLGIPPPPFTRGNFSDPIIEKYETSQRANTPTYGYAV